MCGLVFLGIVTAIVVRICLKINNILHAVRVKEAISEAEALLSSYQAAHNRAVEKAASHYNLSTIQIERSLLFVTRLLNNKRHLVNCCKAIPAPELLNPLKRVEVERTISLAFSEEFSRTWRSLVTSRLEEINNYFDSELLSEAFPSTTRKVA